MMHFSRQETRNNCFSKKNAFTIPVKPSFLLLSVTGPAERERERERRCQLPCMSPRRRARSRTMSSMLDIIEYVMEMVTNSSIRRVQAFSDRTARRSN